MGRFLYRNTGNPTEILEKKILPVLELNYKRVVNRKYQLYSRGNTIVLDSKPSMTEVINSEES